MKRVTWSVQAWQEYTSWQADDRKMVKRINVLIKDIVRGNEAEGIGKPELLRGDLTGWASRRIDQEHRLVYRIVDETLEIRQCRYHY